jgi:hypothetical protein
MSRWSQIAMIIVLCGSTCLVFTMAPHSSDTTPWLVQNNQGGPATIKEATAIATALQLHCLSPKLEAEPQSNVLVSAEPLSEERLSRLFVHSMETERWRDVVLIDVRGRKHLEMNFDPARREYFALWGKLFVYGDPNLISRFLGRPH